MTHRRTNKTRLGTLILTAVPVTALGIATAAGAGAPLLVFTPIAVVAGVVLGAMLARAVPAPPEAEPAAAPGHRTFGVRALLSRAAHEAGPELDEVALRVDVAPPRLRTVGDPECLHRAVTDLIAQAARRSPPGGVVTLAARSARSGVRLEVVDEGPGDCGGGLGEVRRIVEERHGGALRAERAKPRGCRVVVELPGVA
jgi:signal transduction histidine kinase